MSLFSAEGVLRLCKVVTIVAGLLAVAALVGQSVANKVVGDRKALEMSLFLLSSLCTGQAIGQEPLTPWREDPIFRRLAAALDKVQAIDCRS